jgi:predicted NBD/HSP70 family sugar kinase
VGQSLGLELTGADLIRLSQQEDPRVTLWWECYSKKMAITLGNLYLVYFPKKFVLAGGFAMVAAPYFIKPTEARLAELLQARSQAGMPVPTLEMSFNHEDLPLLGAGYQIAEELNNRDS